MKKHVIFHGHFYQPPRENPWTGLIPHQPSASPFSNWNERIYSECYRANSASRYLNPEGRISKINNNYEKLSFNMGPTLLNWIKDYYFELYKKIQEADKKSSDFFNGHGNAIAQVYNHLIMPLADEADKRVQIEWGIKDFESHFNRPPEGMWLAETAIDYKTVDLLIEYGIQFVILSPWQCQSVRTWKSKEKFRQITDPLDITGEAFYIKGEKGNLAAFFYDPILAQGISFEHYLQDADLLHGILLEKSTIGSKPLIHCATDGEIYGHHEPFGDMCYSALTEKIEKGSALVLDNYGHFLETHPPKQEAMIKLGEKNRGSSWSCHHGVSRWYKDCGCSTGSKPGWDQKWRKPLRDSFDALNNELRTLFQTEMAKLAVKEPEKSWKGYIDVLTGTIDHASYAAQHLSRKNKKSFNRFFELLESRKYAMYMYTSCGWFFAELSGIEPVQNICYALRAIELADPKSENLKTQFLNNLAKAKSNILGKATGREIAIKAEKEYRRSPYHVAAEMIARSIAQSDQNCQPTPCLKKEASDSLLGDYKLNEVKFDLADHGYNGKISFSHRYIQKQWNLSFNLEIDATQGTLFNFGRVKVQASEAGINTWIQDQMIIKLITNWNSSDENFTHLLILLENMAQDESNSSNETKLFYYSLINLRIEKLLDRASLNSKSLCDIEILNSYLQALNRLDYHVTPEVELKISEFITQQVIQIRKTPAKINLLGKRLISSCQSIYDANVNCDLTDAQGIAYSLLIQLAKQKLSYAVNSKKGKQLINCCGYLNIDTDELLHKHAQSRKLSRKK